MLHDNHTPRQVIDLLHAEKEQLGDITTSTNDLNNILDRSMHQQKSGKISSEALVEHLEESQLSFDYWTESAKRLKGSLTINPMELELAKAYGSRAAHALRVPDESIQDAATPYSSRCGDKSVFQYRIRLVEVPDYRAVHQRAGGTRSLHRRGAVTDAGGHHGP